MATAAIITIWRQRPFRGGLRALGLGEGRMKNSYPRGAKRYALAIIGEELGMLGALLVFALFLIIWMRVQARISLMAPGFQSLAAAGLSLLLIGQALINIFYTVGLIPTTGITLPFLFRWRLFFLASALTVGLLLAFTRQKGTALRD